MKGKQRVCEADMEVSTQGVYMRRFQSLHGTVLDVIALSPDKFIEGESINKISKEINLNQSENSLSSYRNKTVDIKMDSKCSENKRH